MPRATAWPRTFATTPRPGRASNSSGSGATTPRAAAPATMAAASGCSLGFSTEAARRRSCRSTTPEEGSGSTATSPGLPSVRVPVLSTARVSTSRSTSMAAAFLNRTPAWAPLPLATMIDMGVASPSAHGQAMMRTATAETIACARRGSGPTESQSRKATAATRTTAGTNQAATRSAVRWMGARLRCASATISTMRASSVSAPTRSARMIRAPAPFTVPAISGSPGVLSTGMGSPVTIDSSTVPCPSITTPSTGTFSPGRTRSRSPGCTLSSVTSSSTASRST